jgi:hypothetical protein
VRPAAVPRGSLRFPRRRGSENIAEVTKADLSANEPAHDVLAAEAFAVPAPDPVLSHEPIELPEDPTGISEPHDVLAAEEFAMPAGPPHRDLVRRASSPGRMGLLLLAALAALALASRLRARA